MEAPKNTSATDSLEDEKLLSAALAHIKLSTEAASTGAISLNTISSWEGKAQQNPKTQLARTILSRTDLRSSLLSRESVINDLHVFNHQVEFKTSPRTNQYDTGRCWLFACTNVMRYEIMKKLNLDDFQYSQTYLLFWDKLNKANFYLELSIENADLPLDDRLINHLSLDICPDAGQWDMVVNIIRHYGLVPISLYPESIASNATNHLNTLLKTKLREHAIVLRKLHSTLTSRSISADVVKAAVRAKKEELLQEVWNIMTANLGVPPMPGDRFAWDYYDKNGKCCHWEGTPLDFLKAYGTKPYPIDEYFSLINDPRNEYSKLYTVDKLGNMWGERPVLYVNTDMQTIKEVVIKMIKAGHAVWYGSDATKYYIHDLGIMDPTALAYEDAFDITFKMSKAERLQVNESAMTHAMVISGVHLDTNGKPVRYKVENSYGDKIGDKGYFVMTDKWFEEFAYQIVVPKALAPKHLVKVLEEQSPIVLPPWDPMGALA